MDVVEQARVIVRDHRAEQTEKFVEYLEAEWSDDAAIRSLCDVWRRLRWRGLR